jgi:hypothetical protein
MYRTQCMIIVVVAAIGLSGCVEDLLSDCLAITEQVFVLRHAALQGQIRENFIACLSHNQVEVCRGAFLDATPVVGACMERGGYAGIPDERCKSYHHAACYRPTWLVKLVLLIKNPN